MAQSKIDYSKLSPEELIAALETKDAALQTKDQAETEAKSKIASLESNIAAKDKEIKLSESVITELQNELENKETELFALFPNVKVGKDTYEIVIPVFNTYDSENQTTIYHTAADVQKDSTLAKKLADTKSGVLKKIEKK